VLLLVFAQNKKAFGFYVKLSALFFGYVLNVQAIAC